MEIFIYSSGHERATFLTLAKDRHTYPLPDRQRGGEMIQSQETVRHPEFK